MNGRRIDGIPLPDKNRRLGGKEIPPRHQRPHMQGGGGSSGGGSNKSGSGFAFLPWWAEIGVPIAAAAALKLGGVLPI